MQCYKNFNISVVTIVFSFSSSPPKMCSKWDFKEKERKGKEKELPELSRHSHLHAGIQSMLIKMHSVTAEHFGFLVFSLPLAPAMSKAMFRYWLWFFRFYTLHKVNWKWMRYRSAAMNDDWWTLSPSTNDDNGNYARDFMWLYGFITAYLV